jgi:hypothetical protein
MRIIKRAQNQFLRLLAIIQSRAMSGSIRRRPIEREAPAELPLAPLRSIIRAGCLAALCSIALEPEPDRVCHTYSWRRWLDLQSP